jgi:hypothetical protein
LGTQRWTRAGTFPGNTDRNTIRENSVNLVTKSIRIYPLKWHGWPSLRVGFEGTVKIANKCDTYLKLSQDAPTDADKQRNLELYNKECRKISYHQHLLDLEKEKARYEKMYELLSKYKHESQANSGDARACSSKISSLQKRINRLKIELEVAGNQKCPPNPKCLPLIAPPAPPTPIGDINDYDIRTHKDFHKYVMATNVKPCPNGRAAGNGGNNNGAEGNGGNNDAEGNGGIDYKKELARCQTRFIETFSQAGGKKIGGGNIDMFGGGLYERVCKKSGEQQTISRAFAEKNEDDDRYDIQKHKDFDKLMQKYVHKSRCSAIKPAIKPAQASCKDLNEYDIREHKDYATLMAKVRGNQAEMDIQQHPQYRALMDKYAIRDTTTCPPTYRACKMPKTNPEWAAAYDDITKHPQYKSLMDKYARKDSTTCPPQYVPCPAPGETLDSFLLKSLPISVGDRQKLVNMDGTQRHKYLMVMYKNFRDGKSVNGSTNSTKSPAEEEIRKKITSAVEEGKLVIPGKVAEHPECKAVQKVLLEKYAYKDNSTCPPTYKKCQPCQPCKSIKDMDINNHPDIDKYILKSQIPAKIAETSKQVQSQVAMAKELEKAQAIINAQKKIINGLKSNIKEHPAFTEMMDEYAYRDESVCPPRYRPCSERPAATYDINKHPDINKYLLKSELPSLLDKECASHFRGYRNGNNGNGNGTCR